MKFFHDYGKDWSWVGLQSMNIDTEIKLVISSRCSQNVSIRNETMKGKKMKEQMKKIGSGLKKAGQTTVSATRASGRGIWHGLKVAGPVAGHILREAAPSMLSAVIIGITLVGLSNSRE